MAAEQSGSAGTLYLVPTPIGNLGDITYRAVSTLAAADLIACEDTRHSRRLLQRYEIGKPVMAFHEHNERRVLAQVRARLLEGLDIAYITDAGTPGIADPGFRLVRMAHAHGIQVTVLPGATAMIPALVQSGLPVHSFTFKGFAPRKTGARQKSLIQEKGNPHTLIYYESPYRVIRLLEDMYAILGDRPAALVRELSKVHEETLRGSLAALLAQLRNRTLKGECVVLVAGAEPNPESS